MFWLLLFFEAMFFFYQSVLYKATKYLIGKIVHVNVNVVLWVVGW